MTNPEESHKTIPDAVIRRLTKYLARSQALMAGGEEWVSSSELARTLDLTSSTVRQDLSHLDFSGISKRGYRIDGLEHELARVLGADVPWNLVVVGAGNLGRALALHEEFARRGFNIRGILDVDERKIGGKVGGLKILNMQELPDVVRAEKVDVGVIAVPAEAAQQVADLLIGCGVRGLLNLALAHIVAPPEVSIVDSRVVASLFELTHAIRNRPKPPPTGRRARAEKE